MAYDQVRDVLDRARRFHHESSERFAQLREETGDERMRLILDYLGQRAQALESQIAEYERAAAPTLLDAWVTFAPAARLNEELAQIRVPPGATVPELVRAALRVDEGLLHLYREAARQAPNEDVREVFIRLLAEGEQELSRLVQAVFEMD